MPYSRASLARLALLTATTSLLPVHAGTLYWDTNGDTAGSGNVGGTWDSGTNWSANAAGGSVVGWTNGESVVFSAGTDGVATKTVTIGGTVATPSIMVEEVGLVQIQGGSIDIAGGSVFDTSVLGNATNRSLTWTSAIIGTGGLTLAVNGDTSATGGGSSSLFGLTGTNTFTGDVTITSGVVNAASNFGAATNKVILNGGGIVDANTNGVFTRDIEIGAAGGVIRNFGNTNNFRLQGALTGSGELRRTDAGTTVLTGNGSGFTGALNIQQGTMQIGDGLQTSNLIANTSGIALGHSGGAGSIRYRLDTSFTLSSPVTFANAGSAFHWQGTGADDVLTINSAFGSSSSIGTLGIASGGVSLGSGADVKISSVSITSTPSNSAAAVIGTLNIGSGASLVTKYLGLGDASNTSGIINQTGGTLTVESGGNGIRIGHWANGGTPGSAYNLSGGTLDASGLSGNSGDAQLVSIGWDGLGSMSVGGGASTATLKAVGIQLDKNRSGAGSMATNLTVGTNGVVEVGSRGILAQGSNDSVVLNGGTIRSTGTSNWNATFNANAASVFDGNAGTTTTVSGVLTGSGNIQQTGSGVFSYTGASTAYTGNLNVGAAGTLTGTGTIAGNVTIDGTLAAGATAAAASVGTLVFGDAGAGTTTTAVNGAILMDLNGASVATGNDKFTVNDHLSFGASSVLNPTFYGAAATGGSTYNLINYTGTLTGAPVLDAGFINSHRQTFALDTATAGQINLSVTGSAANLVWTGDGAGNAWNVNGVSNWNNGGSSDKFYQTDSVSFTDAGDASVPVNVSGVVNAPGVTVDSTKDYTFAGTGSITGSGQFTKSGTGSLTVLTDFTPGAMNISAGTVNFGNGGTTGGLLGSGTITLAADATLNLNRSDATSFNRAFAAGSAGTFVKSGAGNLTLGSFQLLPRNVTVNGGTLTVTGGGFGGNRLDGAGVITVNSGATMVLAAGSAHALGGSDGAMTESMILNGGTLTVNQEQYFNSITMNGATVNGSAEIRSSNATNWAVTGSIASTMSARVNMVGAANFNVGDVTGSAAEDLTVSGQVTGSGAFNKNGAGTMRVTGNNNFTGALAISGGVLQAASNNALGFGGAIGNTAVNGTTVTGGGALDLSGVTVNEAITLNGGKLINSNTSTAGTLASGIAGIRITAVGSGYTSAPTVALSGGGGSGATATTALSGATVGSVTTTAAGSGYTSAPTVTLNGGAGTGATATAVISSLTLTGTNNEIGGDGNLSVNAIITGTGGYTKTGAGTLTLGTGASTLAGDIVVNGGAINVAVQGNATTSAFGNQASSRTVTINNGAIVNFNTNNVLGNGAVALANLPTFTVNQGGTLAANNYNVIGAVNLNGGTLTRTGTGTPGSYQGFELKGTVTTGGSAQSTITSTGGYGHHLAGNINFNVGNAVAGADLIVAAALRNASPDVGGTGGLTKTGSGTMALNASNTYTGATMVSAGTLLVNGALGNTAVTVGIDGILGGGSATAGTIAGNVTVDGTLAPGSSAGTLALGGNLLLNSTAILNWELDAASPLSLGLGVNDLVTVGGQLTLDGTLNVAGTSSFAGVNTGTWTLLTYGSLVDNSLVLGSMPTLDSGLSWQLTTGDNRVNVSIVPEPRAALLGALGLMFLFRRRR
ncbi:beta strand repeat-containing protein [Luteolibacter luteus]|uniref:PEP-CTERM sorting domain-containing protein n=1 Tax=Luteolibacter luteus TaxID=2728835 RepID=A0A858REQ4_9BACT|nr:autotransporter-associated beta strand repeat-containing protein [Luteolibacter luteus]QJE95576.1 hypothetical protein HHL09_07175 [Luteolibacter luteus]